ncbi:hypothetical protein [Paracoccus sanguinis]|uniref:hypothetical protein n=1 Tax=Paracoccus sanguinis TaxID=1545044 RepID=UPI00051FB758|nr:hypothetical protein [Paracoccus sanguinis]KGJ15129.1 hypothetical protein IX54_03385 [Paracoccus sanguinis]
MVDTAAVAYLTEAGDWGSGIPRIENGWRITGGAVNPGADEGLANWPLQALAARTRILKERVDLLSLRASVQVTVGTGGQFSTINDALAYLSERRPAYVAGGFTASIRLLAGFVMREQVVVSGVNLGWARIESVDAEVQIDRAYLTQAISGRYPAFCARDGGFLPTIAVLFTMMATGSGLSRDGIFVVSGGGVSVEVGKGVKAAGGCGIFASTGSVVSANAADFRNAVESGAQIVGGSRAALQGANLSGSKRGIYAGNGAVVHAGSANCSGCSEFGLLAEAGASVNAHQALCQKSPTGTSDSDIAVLKGSTINAFETAGGTSVTPNTVTAAGVIFR